MTGGLWSLLTVVGPILLIAAIIFAWMSNRKAGRGNRDRAEAGADRLREQINAEDQRKGHG